MRIPFFDSNPEMINEVRAMNHNTKEYKKLLRKVLMEIGGLVYLFNSLKATDEGNRLRKNYFRNLIATGAFIILMFVWIFVAVIITGGRDTNQFNSADIAFFIGFIIVEIATIFVTIFSAFRCRRILLQGMSYLIDNYSYESYSAGGNTLSNYKFQRVKLNKISISVSIIIFIMIFGLTTLSNGTINRLFSSGTQSFSKAGMTITLTNGFTEKDYQSFTSVYSSQRVIVFALKEEFSLKKGLSGLTLTEYAQLIIDNNKLESQIENKDNLTYFTYKKQANGKENLYFACVYKASDAFWLIQFVCESKYYNETSASIIKWAESVKV